MREKRKAADGSHDIVKDYWQKRYERKFSIGSSGHISFNEKYNSYVSGPTSGRSARPLPDMAAPGSGASSTSAPAPATGWSST